MDEKGRIVIPADIRRTFGLNKSCVRMDILFYMSKIMLELVPEDGCVSVANSIEACGASGPSSTPGRGLKIRGDKNG